MHICALTSLRTDTQTINNKFKEELPKVGRVIKAHVHSVYTARTLVDARNRAKQNPGYNKIFCPYIPVRRNFNL